MGRVVLPDAARVGHNRAELELDGDELRVTLSLLKQVLGAARGALPTARASHAPSQPAPAAPPQMPKVERAPPPAVSSYASEPTGSEPVPPLPLVRTWSSSPGEHQNLPVTALSWHQAVGSLESWGDAHAGWLFSASRGCINVWECQPGGGIGGEPAMTLLHGQAVSIRATSLDVEPSSQVLLAAAADVRSGTEPAAVCVYTLRGMDFMSMGGQLLPPKPIGGSLPKQPGGASMPLVTAPLTTCGGPMDGCVALGYGKDVAVMALARTPSAEASTKAHWQAVGGAAHITSLAAWPHAPLMLCGTSGGTLQLWDLRMRPPSKATAATPAATVTRPAGGSLVSVAACGAASCVSVGASGDVTLWDVRRMVTPPPVPNASAMAMSLHAAHGRPVLPLGNGARLFAGSVSGTGDAVAALSCQADGKGSTLHAACVVPSSDTGGGLYFPGVGEWSTAGLAGAGGVRARETGHGAGSPVSWGKGGTIIYVGGADGGISVFRL